MRPTADTEMHSAVEEVTIDPFDCFIDVGSLVLEGRVPGLSSKGYGEGIHCPPQQGQPRHQCNSSMLECQKFELMLKHMVLLWKNNIPMSLEVLLSPECCQCSMTDMASVDISAAPDASHLLLEQWFIHMVPRRVPEPTIAPRSLIQVMRSYLHFSQISAWYSLSGGMHPRNIYYRISVPGEAFSSRFRCTPHLHTFPVASLGRNASIKVTVKSIPRSPGSLMPKLPCTKHGPARRNIGVTASPLVETVSTATSLQQRNNNNSRKLPQFAEKDSDIVPEEHEEETRKKVRKHSKGEPADLLLGESLLDPPQSLQMYPRRYQSPSRCGSPSVEVPEHLMFGPRAQSPLEASPEPAMLAEGRRGRPQRRPVIERFLKKSGEAMHKELFKVDPGTSPKQHKEEKAPDAPFWPIQGPSFCKEGQAGTVPEGRRQSFQENQQELRLLLLNSDCNERASASVPLAKAATVPHLDRCGSTLKQSFKNLSLCPESRPSSKHKPSLCNSSSVPVSGEPLLNLEHDLKRTSQAQSKEPCLDNGKTTLQTECEQSVSASQSSSTGNCILFENAVGEGSHKKAVGHSRTWSEGLCDLKLKDGVVGKGSQIFSNLIHKHKVRQLMCKARTHPVPTAAERAQFRRSLDSATSMVFHQKTGLPLTSSPAPLRKSGASFDFDSSLTSVSAIKRALFEKEPQEEESSPEEILSSSAPASTTTSSLIVNFEESVLNGRLEPVSTVQGFVAEIGASGSFCPRHITLPVTVFFYSLQDIDKVVSPYLGHINLGMKGYHVPKTGTIQVTLFNPHQTVVKMFVVRYDFSDMPPNCQTFIRQRTLYMPTDGSETDAEASRWLRYLIHLRFASSRSGRIYLHTDVRIIVFRKSDLDAATIHGDHPYELRSFTQCPVNPKFSPCK